MTTSPDALACIRLLSVKGVGAAKLRRVVALAASEGVSLSSVIEDERALAAVLTAVQLEELEATGQSAAAELDELEEAGVRAISVLDEEYPATLRSRLENAAPPILFARGAHESLKQHAVGFCGSRKASHKGLSVAADCAEQLGREGINVISGYAAGVDLQAHRAALLAGGTTALVLAEGICHFRIKREIRDAWDWDRVLVLSQFLPRAKWSVGNAMQRNLTIAGLSNAMIVIEARATGGSIAAGKECLKRGVPLFAPVYAGMPESATGNRILLAEGAREIRKSRQTNRAALDDLMATVSEDEPASAGSAGERVQMSMFG